MGVWIEGGIDSAGPGHAAGMFDLPGATEAEQLAMALQTSSVESGAGQWEVEAESHWIPFDETARAALGKAQAEGCSVATYVSRGYYYEIDLEACMQLNVTTRRCRR